MASLSYGDMPLTSVRRAAARSGPTSGSSRGLRVTDPEKADILRGGGGGGGGSKMVASVDDVEAWDAADGGAGGDGGGSRASVWRTALCRYRFVLGGIAALVLAALLVGIAIGAHEGEGRAAAAAASTASARGAEPDSTAVAAAVADAGEGSSPPPPKADAVPPHGEIPGGGLPGKGGMKAMGVDDELEVEADTSSRESGDDAGPDPGQLDGSALASSQTIAVAAHTAGTTGDDHDLSLSLPRRRRRRRVVARPAVWGGKHKKISPNERDDLDEEARGSSKRWLGDESLER